MQAAYELRKLRGKDSWSSQGAAAVSLFTQPGPLQA
jgi:hypothetical protein